MTTPRITPEENERIARREKIVHRTIIGLVIAAFIALAIWSIARPSGETNSTEPTPACVSYDPNC